ncbi:MAG: sulfatase family protein [Candidatus Brocadiia bacterium]
MSQDRPNIVFLMADDMGFGDAGCYGATKVPTPHIDRLARRGVRFADAHSASAVCTPSRYAVLTGRYCWRGPLQRGVLGGLAQPVIEPGRPTVASVLRGRGYATAAVGKWHLGLGWRSAEGEVEPWGDGFAVDYRRPLAGGPCELGFDYFFGIAGSLDMPPYCFIENDRTVGIPSVEKDVYHPQQRRGLMTPGWRDEEVDATFARKAVEFIEAHAAEPFFLYLTPSAPHRPCVPPDFLRGASQAGPRGDMVCMVDWMVGEVDSALQRLGIADHTLFLVTSDNGARLACYDGKDYGHRSCGPWRGGKADIWDGGHREPFVARWPARLQPDTTCEATVCLADLMATAAAIAGAELPPGAGEDSVDILPALLGRPLAPRGGVVHHSMDGTFAIREGPWKLILGLGSGGFSDPRRIEPQPGGPQGQLYHMAEDPQETTNLWLDRPAVVERLATALDGVRQRGG